MNEFLENESDESNMCICDTIQMLANEEKPERQQYMPQKRYASRKPKYAEVTPINPYLAERVQGHYDVCPVKYDQYCPGYGIPQVKPRPLPSDFRSTNVII